MISKDLIAASSTSIILLILTKGESYGYEIIQQIKELSDNQLLWKDGMLYPVLHKLEKQELITSRWLLSQTTGKRRKYYSLTEAGKKRIEDDKEQWMLMYSFLKKLWG